MELTIARHPVADIRFGEKARLDVTTLIINEEELRAHLLEDDRLVGADLEIVHSVIVLVPGTSLPILLPLTSAKKTFPLPSVDSASGWLLAVGIVHSSTVTES